MRKIKSKNIFSYQLVTFSTLIFFGALFFAKAASADVATFGCVWGSQSWTVPANVPANSTATVDVKGGASNYGADRVTGNITISAGQVYTIEAGCAGGYDDDYGEGYSGYGNPGGAGDGDPDYLGSGGRSTIALSANAASCNGSISTGCVAAAKGGDSTGGYAGGSPNYSNAFALVGGSTLFAQQNGADGSVTITYTVADITAPTITNISSNKANGNYKVGEVIDIDVTFSENVTSTGNVAVTLETGDIDRTCTFVVSNASTGTCDYTVQAGDASLDLTTASITGTIKDAALNTMTNFVPTTSLATNKNIVIDAVLPAAPTSPTANAISPSRIDLSWTAATDNMTVTGYNVYRYNGSAYAKINPGAVTATAYSDLDRTGSTLYQYKITAYDATGNESLQSVVASATTLASTVPDAPIIGTATRGNAQIAVTFTPSANNGGSAITSYDATCTSSDGGAIGTVNGSASPIIVTGLTNLKSYTCTVTATNGVGISVASAASNAAIPASDEVAPGVPVLTLPASTNGSLTFSVTITGTDNVGVTGWIVKEASNPAPVAGDSGWRTSGISGTTSATITGNITASTTGLRSFYAWTKDASNNISPVSTVKTVTVTGPVNYATFESDVKSFANNNAPSYGNINWGEGSGGAYAFSAKWGSYGTTSDGQFYNPTGIAIDANGDVYVADANNNRIQKFSSTGTFITKWGSFGAGDGQFSNPYGIAINANGDVYVADTSNNRIQKFSSTGTFIAAWGSSGSGDGQFSTPYGIAIDANGDVYVSDASNRRIQKFSSTGTFITAWGSVGFGNGEFNGPYGIAINANGDVYVTETGNNRIQKFSSTGTFITAWGSSGFSNGQFSTPHGIAIDANGDVYVTDTGSKRIQKFSSTGTFITAWGSSGSGDGQFSNPYGVAINANGDVYVADITSNHRIQKFVSGTSVKLRVRTGTTADGSGASWAAWSDDCRVNNNSDINTNASSQENTCVDDGDRYFQYQATLETNAGTNNPLLSSVTIETQATYPTDFASSYLISSPFNTNNKFNKLNSITGATTGGGSIGFQVKAASNNTTGLAAAQWCGPDPDGAGALTGCAASPGESNSFYTSGQTITGQYASQSSEDANKVFQYAAFLKASEASPADPSLAVPVITSIESSFSFNIPPTVSVPVVAPQKTDGTLEITYDINGTKGNGDAALIQNSPWVLLTYQPGVAVTLNADNGTSIVLNKIATSPIPTAGKILIDNELINFTSVSNVTDTTIQLDGLTREYSFNGGVSYITKTSTHAANTTVYFVAENVSGAVEDMTLNGDGSATTGNLITWNPNLADSAEKTIFGGKKLTDMAFKVVANDSDLLNPLNAANPTAANKALDLESPSISSIAADLTTVLEPEKSSGIFGISKTVPVKITFSEPVVTQGDLTIKLDMGNSRVSNCVINISGTAVDNSTCNVTINEGDSSNDLSLISGAAIVGTINDAVSNVTVNPALPVKTDLHDSPDIKVDGVRPTVTSVTETSDNSNNTKKAKPGDKVTLAIATSEELKTDTEPVVTIAGHAATVSGTESPYTAEYTYASTDNVDIEGDIAFTIDLIDTAGNDASPTANENNANINDGTVVFDRTVPTISNISITSNNSLDNKKAKVGDVVSMTFLASEPLQTPVVKIARANDDSPKAADTITNVGQTYTATYTMLVSDKEEDIPYVIEFVDEAENLGGTLTEDSGVIFDRTKPTISQKTAVSNPSNDSTPNYVFATNEAGAITYTGSCTSATLDAIKDGNPTTDNTITFSQLADGTYSNCKIKVTDATGNISDELAVSEFEIDTVGENISINAPATNAHVNSMAIRFAFEETIQSGNIVLTDQSLQQVATAIAADKYADGVEHTQVINGLAEGAYTVAINAIDIAGNAMQTASVSNIVYDTTAPTLSISADNYFNSYAVSSDISISSNNNSEALQSGVITFADRADVLPDMVCNLKQSSLSEGNHSGINLSDECEGSVTLVDGTAYDISFQGTDLAGNSATEIITSKTFDITAPIISSFTSTTSDTCGASACGTTVDDMNITVVMNEPVVSGEMVVRLDNTANPRTDITLNQIASENVVGTYDVLGPNLGHDTDDLSISSVLSSTLTDRAGNVQNNLNIPEGENLNDNKNIVIDTGPPTLVRFSAPEGVYSNDISKNSFTVTAEYSERLSTLNDGSSIDITFNSGKTLTLDNISTDKLTGIYEVSDENVESLAVTQINSQNAVDLIGNPLTSTDLPAQNISGVKIDTVAPSLGSTPIAIQNTSGKTSDMTPQITLDASDNFSFSDDGKVYFKIGDAGSAWCGPINYQATINASSDDLDITSSTCGGNTSNGNKKVVVKFVDSAGNESQIADATVELDKLEPGLEKFTTDTATGIYGSGTSIKIIATYDEPLASGTLVVTLNNGKQITLDAVENENTLTTGDSPYIVGATGSGEDTSALRVASIQSESVSDTSNPANVQSVSNLSGKENLDSNGEAISIDTTAPTAAAGSITLDRYTEDGKIKVSINPSDGGVALDGMAAQIKILTSDSACNFTDASVETFTTFPQTFTYDDTTDSIRKACVKLTDARNNTSGVLEVKAPNTPQQFSYVDLTNDTLTGAILTWKAPIEEGTGLFSKYDLLSCESSDGNACVPSVSHEIASKSQNYYVFNSGLSKSNKYCYNVIFKDLDGNISKSSSTECKVPGEGPVLANTDVDFLALPFVGNITESSANVVFETINKNDANAPLATTAKVEVFTSDDFSVAAYKTVEDALGVIHSVKITGLEQNKKYYLKITATDSTDKSKVLSYGAAVSATTNPGLTFTTAGTLSIIESITESVITDSKAVISFTTNENAKCFIDFKDSLTVTYNDLSANLEKEYAKTHSITLTQLLAKTAYDYKITCSDSNSVVVTSAERKFTTLEKGLTQGELDASTDGTAPEISSIALANVTGENATITWTTDEAANSLLAYELDGTDFMLMSGDYLVSLDTKKYTSSHTVQLKGLLPASKYTFTALSTDASGNIGQSTASTFTTKEPSSLSSIKVLSKALGQATISWTTGEPTSSLIEYGLTTSYGSTKEDSSKVKEHLVTLSDLTPGETYHFRVKGEDDLQNIFASSDITFQPKAPPKISDFKVDSITEHGAVVTFNTNVSTDAIVNFENTEKSEDAGFQGRPDYVSKHEIKLKDLTSGATFSVKLKVRDEDGNETEETFPNFTTTKDEVAPKIDRVKTDSALTQNDKVQAIISWSTDELSTGDILYKEGKSGDEKKFEVNSALSFSHIGVITSFKSGVVYYFKVRSTDSAGNTVTSTDYALLTPKQRQNIIQVIVGNFTDIFGWAKF